MLVVVNDTSSCGGYGFRESAYVAMWSAVIYYGTKIGITVLLLCYTAHPDSQAGS